MRGARKRCELIGCSILGTRAIARVGLAYSGKLGHATLRYAVAARSHLLERGHQLAAPERDRPNEDHAAHAMRVLHRIQRGRRRAPGVPEQCQLFETEMFADRFQVFDVALRCQPCGIRNQR